MSDVPIIVLPTSFASMPDHRMIHTVTLLTLLAAEF
jgi:hypothetical protein